MKNHLAKSAILFGVVALTVAAANYGFKAQQLRPNPVSAAPEKPMILLKGGAFLMGTPDASTQSHGEHSGHASPASIKVKDPAHGIGDDDERPVHRVTL